MSDNLAGYLARKDLQVLIERLQSDGYEVVGPQVHEGTILYQPLGDVTQLPGGWHDQQAPGHYRLHSDDAPRYFAWANGPQALKPLLFAPREVIWQARRSHDGQIEFIAPDAPTRRLAVLGVRACDLAALSLQDQHFLEGAYVDPYYADRRRGLLLISVDCSHPAETCFCASTGDGPHNQRGYDLNLTELDEGYLVEAGTEAGESLLRDLPLIPVSDAHRSAKQTQYEQAVAAQHRTLPLIPLHNLLREQHDHPRWDDIAERCLACGNCTQVCPSCFCHREGELVTLDGDQSEHTREWDSCFTAGHGYLAGHQVRPDTKSRYRQWMTHKLDTWHDQYGRSGCVGCGRCISWCPVGIDFVEEVNVLSRMQDKEPS